MPRYRTHTRVLASSLEDDPPEPRLVRSESAGRPVDVPTSQRQQALKLLVNATCHRLPSTAVHASAVPGELRLAAVASHRFTGVLIRTIGSGEDLPPVQRIRPALVAV